MDTISKLASSLGRKDEGPNEKLAKEIADKSDTKAVAELVGYLIDKNKNIQSDCIKVLYEIGSTKPELITPYASTFISLLDHKNNRLQWGAMLALNYIAGCDAGIVYPALAKIATVAEKGSVITKDNYVAILIKLCAVKKYSNNAFALLNEQLLSCASNQLPMYAENAAPFVGSENKVTFINSLVSRLNDFEKESKRRRVEKVIKKMRDI